MKKKVSPYTNIGIFWQTFNRFQNSMRGNETADSFLNKLMDLYEAMVGTKTIEEIENRSSQQRIEQKARQRKNGK